MKNIIAGIVVIITLAAVLFVTPAYAPCIEGPGINCNGYPPQTLTQIKSDMLNYAITDKPHIIIDGTPHIAVHLEVDDASPNIMSEYDLNLSSYGNASYALDISSYKPGVYSVIATSLMSKVTTSFAVGLGTTGPIVTLNVAKNTYVQGDFITIAGTVGPDDAVQLSLIDPNDNVVTSIQTVSNNVGQYSTSALKIPTNAISGTWKITADHNTSHTMFKILVQPSSSNDVMKNDIGIISPLKQFKSGIRASDVQCTQSLELVIKAEDGSPACVKFSTAEVLTKHGWASSESGISSDGERTYIIQDSSTSSMPCDIPYALKTSDVSPLFPNDTQITTSYIPVFFMPTNSTGIICVRYENLNMPSSGYARIFDAQDLSKNTGDVSISPSEIQVPTGVTNTTFTIKSGNTGFYGIGFLCGGLPLAVEYDNNSNLVKDDFPWWGKAFNCPAITYSLNITGIRGIGVHYIPEITYSKIDYNITGTSVSSVHLSPTIQNVTFTLNVHTFNDSATFWFDAKDSNYVKFNGDPKLEQEGSDPCTWSFTNSNAIPDESQWYKMVGKVTVIDRPITIPPHTNANYTFSILAKNLDAGYYGFNPAFFGRPIDSTIPLENMGGGSVGSYYPVIMGLNKYLDPSGICSR